MWTLAITLPLMIGNKVPGDEKRGCFFCFCLILYCCRRFVYTNYFSDAILATPSITPKIHFWCILLSRFSISHCTCMQHTHPYPHVHIDTHIYTHMHTHTHVLTHAHAGTHTLAHMYARICTHTHMHIQTLFLRRNGGKEFLHQTSRTNQECSQRGTNIRCVRTYRTTPFVVWPCNFCLTCYNCSKQTQGVEW